MNKLEKDVRVQSGDLRNLMRKLTDMDNTIHSNRLDPLEFKNEIAFLYNEIEKAKTELKKVLDVYFEYEKNHPEIPANFLFRKLYKTFF